MPIFCRFLDITTYLGKISIFLPFLPIWSITLLLFFLFLLRHIYYFIAIQWHGEIHRWHLWWLVWFLYWAHAAVCRCFGSCMYSCSVRCRFFFCLYICLAFLAAESVILLPCYFIFSIMRWRAWLLGRMRAVILPETLFARWLLCCFLVLWVSVCFVF